MNIEVKAFCARLNISFNEEIVSYYGKAVKLYAELKDYILDKNRLTDLNNKYHVFRKYFKEILAAADMIREDNDLTLHTYIYVAILQAGGKVSILEPVNRDRADTDFAPLFAYLYFWEEMVRKMEDRHISARIISDTLNGFESEMNEHYSMYGRPGIRHCVEWFVHWFHGDIYRFGRLQFEMKTMNDPIRVYKNGDDIKILMDGVEMHRRGMIFGSVGQDDEEGRYFAVIEEDGNRVTGYAVNAFGECVPERVTLTGYTEVLRAGVKALGVHIMADEPFSAELCEASYEEAIRGIRSYYPEFDFQVMYCNSWMLEKRLRQIMGRDTNITRFASKFYAFPVQSQGTSVYSSLYHLPAPVTPDKVPANTSMQKAVKEYLCSGNYFYEKAGLFFVNNSDDSMQCNFGSEV